MIYFIKFLFLLLNPPSTHHPPPTSRQNAQAVAKLAERFNGADLRNICTEAGMFAIRDERDYAVQEDFMRAARKLAEAKKLEASSLTYSAEFAKGE